MKAARILLLLALAAVSATGLVLLALVTLLLALPAMLVQSSYIAWECTSRAVREAANQGEKALVSGKELWSEIRSAAGHRRNRRVKKEAPMASFEEVMSEPEEAPATA